MGWLPDLAKIKRNWYYKILVGLEDWRGKAKSDFGEREIEKRNQLNQWEMARRSIKVLFHGDRK